MARDFAIKNQARLLEHMVRVRDILNDHNIECWLHYGTCLGAIREKGFIPHDNDADMGVYFKDIDALFNLITVFQKAGFSTTCKFSSRLLQLVSNETDGGEQIDLFIEKPVNTLLGKRWDLFGRINVSNHYLKKLQKIDFLGHMFNIPNNAEGLMRKLYGKTWKIPIINVSSRQGLRQKITTMLKRKEKPLSMLLRFVKSQMRLKKIAKKAK